MKSIAAVLESMNTRRILRITLCCLAATCMACTDYALQISGSSSANVEQLLHQGQTAASHGDITAARASFDEAMRLQPGNAQAVFEAGLLAAGLGNVREAETLFRRCTNLDPDLAKGQYMLGLTLIADPGTRLDWPAAIRQFRAALRLQPVYPEASARLGQGLLALNDPSSAIQVLRAALTSTPQSTMLLTQLGKAYESTQQRPQAIDAYRRAITADPDDADAAVALAKLLLAEGHAEDAVQTLEATLRRNPDRQAAQYVLARALRQTGRTTAAAAALAASTRLAQREPNAAEARRLSNAALQEAAAGHLTDAEDHLRKAIRLCPDYGIAHYNLGLILADRQRMLDAQYQLIQAVSLLPGQAKPLFDLGRVERLLGNGTGANREQLWAMQLDPSLRPAAASPPGTVPKQDPVTTLPPLPVGWSNTADAHVQLASDLASVGDHVGAAGQLERAVALAPGRADLRVALAQELAAAGDQEGARVEENNAKLIAPESSHAQ